MDYQLAIPQCNPKVNYGQRLLPNCVQDSARANPSRVVYKIAKSSDVSKGFLEITIGQVSKAVDFMAYWLDEKLEKLEKKNGQQTPIAFMGAPDIRYWIMILAAIKIGSPILLPSLKNSVANNKSLFDDTKCRILFYTKTSIGSRASDLAAAMNNQLCSFRIPEWTEIEAQNSRSYAYTDTWDTAAKKPIMILHTSGSTGNPKPITYNNAFVNMMDSCRLIPSYEGHMPTNSSMVQQRPGDEFYAGFPFFHLGGLAFYFQPIWYDVVMVLSSPDTPASGKAIIDLMKHTKLTSVASPPSLLEDIAKEYKEDFEMLCGNTKILIYGGGPLASFAGDYFSKHIPVMAQFMGSTEAGFLPLLSKEPKYWKEFYFHKTHGGMLFESHEEHPDLYELCIVPVPGQEWCQGIFQTFPNLDKWRTKDFYKPHPTNPDYWINVGRVDDMLVLSNGEKFNPVAMELLVTEHPAIESVLVVGQARFQCAMILELKDNVSHNAEIIDDIWPLIEKANSNSPAHAQINKDLIILADPNKPFQRTGKGTIQRWKTTKEYTAEIDALYGALDSKDTAKHLETALSSTTDVSAVKQFLFSIVTQILPGKDIKMEDDLFVLGLDSLQTSHLSSAIRNALKDQVAPTKEISTRFIYENPSILQLQDAILALTSGTQVKSEAAEDEMRAMVERYASGLPTKAIETATVRQGKINTALTGSTGSLGFYIILALLANPNFGDIYCLDRSAGASESFAKRWAVLGEECLTPALGRIHFYQVEFGHQTFGLSDYDYGKISNNVNVIIHNAWKVNFNHPLSSFESQVKGVAAFAHLSLKSPLRPSFYFVSSISSSDCYPGIVPEVVLSDYSVPLPMGYGRSKYVSERIIDIAARQNGANMNVFRVGQVSGPVLRRNRGKWSLQEWLPSLIKTSGELGIIPETLGGIDAIDWIPVDILGRVMVELIQSPPQNPEQGARVYNLTNPHLSSFRTLVPSIQEYYATRGKCIQVVKFKEWLRNVEELGEDEKTLERYPAKKVQDFLEGIKEDASGKNGGFETNNSVRDSQSMRDLHQVDTEWMNIWLDQWNF